MGALSRGFGGAVVIAITALGGMSLARSMDQPPPAPPGADEAGIRNRDIEFFEARVVRDPRSARDFAQLGRLYLQRARETGDNGDLIRAESNARHSLALRAARNDEAFGVLASALLSQHRFGEALQISRRLVDDDSTSIAARGLLGENLFELGHYDEARRVLGTLTMYRNDPGIAPRLARWAELTGHPEDARRLLRTAASQAGRRHGMPKEQLAWFHLRLGDLALRYGHLDEAKRELDAGLAIHAGDARLLATQARLAAVKHQWRDAADQGEQAIATAVDPATLGLLHDAYRMMGDSAKANAYYRAMALAVLRQPGPFHRAWSLFLLDHDREAPTVLANVREELRSRRDIYGYDLLAWALHRSGRDEEARVAMQHALALGTRDAMLFHHAGMIERALGHDDLARRYLEAALATNPYWDPFHPAEARAVLDSLAHS
jgi:tetratricopeptide (TPR) repeat protein